MSEFGYCKCGCGQKTRLAPRNSRRSGWIKGQPLDYIHGHSVKGCVLGIRKPNRHEVRGDHAAVFIDKRDGTAVEFLVDLSDLEIVLRQRWMLSTSRAGAIPYPVFQINRSGKKTTTALHFLLLGKPSKGLQVDHIDRNPLNNRRANLRVVTPSLNCYNRFSFSATGLRGSFKETDAYRRKPYRAQCTHNGKKLNLGRFATPEEAHECVIAYLRKNGLIPTRT